MFAFHKSRAMPTYVHIITDIAHRNLTEFSFLQPESSYAQIPLYRTCSAVFPFDLEYDQVLGFHAASNKRC